jgi:hypothetical protein
LRLRRLAVAAAVAVAACMLPAPARAADCSRQDVSAIVQYCEVLPSVEGGSAPPTATADVPTLRDALDRADVSKLEALGPLGKALLDLPAGTPLAPLVGDRLLDLQGLLSGDLDPPAVGAPPQTALDALNAATGVGGPVQRLLLALGLTSLGVIGVILALRVLR